MLPALTQQVRTSSSPAARTSTLTDPSLMLSSLPVATRDTKQAHERVPLPETVKDAPGCAPAATPTKDMSRTSDARRHAVPSVSVPGHGRPQRLTRLPCSLQQHLLGHKLRECWNVNQSCRHMCTRKFPSSRSLRVKLYPASHICRQCIADRTLQHSRDVPRAHGPSCDRCRWMHCLHPLPAAIPTCHLGHNPRRACSWNRVQTLLLAVRKPLKPELLWTLASRSLYEALGAVNDPHHEANTPLKRRSAGLTC
jgi:hypothetical protein